MVRAPIPERQEVKRVPRKEPLGLPTVQISQRREKNKRMSRFQAKGPNRRKCKKMRKGVSRFSRKIYREAGWSGMERKALGSLINSAY